MLRFFLLFWQMRNDNVYTNRSHNIGCLPAFAVRCRLSAAVGGGRADDKLCMRHDDEASPRQWSADSQNRRRHRSRRRCWTIKCVVKNKRCKKSVHYIYIRRTSICGEDFHISEENIKYGISHKPGMKKKMLTKSSFDINFLSLL